MEIARYHLNQSDLILKPIGIWSRAFSCKVACFYIEFSLAPCGILFALISCCDIFELGFSIQPKCTLSPNNKSRAN